MIDISVCLGKAQKVAMRGPWISLCGKLEAIVGNYFVSSAGPIYGEKMQRVYYDAKIDTFTEAVETVPENRTAC